ncbi:glycosyl hydrolase family 28-related protein [Paenibacillus hodogayensis]|uniref:Glycosyl hydrolase family 28-related protein n=1 Tax=Paenibacillus hodogayensis TaxID=279208 RepID=A0ABV5W310_9BACL
MDSNKRVEHVNLEKHGTGAEANQAQAEANAKISRRQMLTSIGVTGVAVASGTLIAGLADAIDRGPSVQNAVYGEGCVPNIDSDCVDYHVSEGLPERTVGQKLRECVSVLDFGAKGDGVTDDSAAIAAALEYCNSKRNNTVNPVYQSPGAKLIIPPGTYAVSQSFTVFCHLEARGAVFKYPDSFAATAITIGGTDANHCLIDAIITLPDLIKPLNLTLTAGSKALRVCNVWSSDLYPGRIYYFETGQHYDANGRGNLSNRIYGGFIQNCKVAYLIQPTGPINASFCNELDFFGGEIQQVGTMYGVRTPGWRHVVLYGTGVSTVTNIRFRGTSLEGYTSEYHVYANGAQYCLFDRCRWESGLVPDLAPGTKGNFFDSAASPSPANTFTQPLYRTFNNGDKIVLGALTAPVGLANGEAYYVINSTGAGGTFQLSTSPSDTVPRAFTTVGNTVRFTLPVRFYFDGPAGYYQASNNEIIGGTYAFPNAQEVIYKGPLASNNQLRTIGQRFVIDQSKTTDFGTLALSNTAGANLNALTVYAQEPYSDPIKWRMGITAGGKLRWNGTSAGQFGTDQQNFGPADPGTLHQSISFDSASLIQNTNTNGGVSASSQFQAKAGPTSSNLGSASFGYFPAANSTLGAFASGNVVIQGTGTGTEIPKGILCYAPAAEAQFGIYMGGSSPNMTVDKTHGMFIADVAEEPVDNPSGGVYVYVHEGALKVRGANGTVTTIAPA